MLRQKSIKSRHIGVRHELACITTFILRERASAAVVSIFRIVSNARSATAILCAWAAAAQ